MKNIYVYRTKDNEYRLIAYEEAILHKVAKLLLQLERTQFKNTRLPHYTLPSQAHYNRAIKKCIEDITEKDYKLKDIMKHWADKRGEQI